MLQTSLGQDDRLGGFRKCLHRLAGIEVGVDIGEPARIAHRQHQHGHGFAVALRDAAHGILRARAVLHAEGADAVAGGDAGDRVRHVDADALLPHHDRADIGIGGKFDQVIDRIAAEDLDALALHDFRDRRTELHDASPQIAAPVRSGGFASSWNRNLRVGKAAAAVCRGSADMRLTACGEQAARAGGCGGTAQRGNGRGEGALPCAVAGPQHDHDQFAQIVLQRRAGTG